jgi:hypothetical protein
MYTIERFTGNPQPHCIQVVATSRSSRAPVVSAHAWTSHGISPLVHYTEVCHYWKQFSASVAVSKNIVEKEVSLFLFFLSTYSPYFDVSDLSREN